MSASIVPEAKLSFNDRGLNQEIMRLRERRSRDKPGVSGARIWLFGRGHRRGDPVA